MYLDLMTLILLNNKENKTIGRMATTENYISLDIKITWTSPDGKIHNQIDHILVDRRRH
jgi:hypothetical protein